MIRFTQEGFQKIVVARDLAGMEDALQGDGKIHDQAADYWPTSAGKLTDAL